ncbi:MAG TPA: hypothetical protein VGB63_16450 [Pedobacter sp.]|jgi:hypothetical protein
MYKYIYVDDTQDQIEIGAINGIKQGGVIDVDFVKPGLWEEKITELTEKLKTSHGLIVDLRLNDMPYDDVNRAQYRGSTVAQELRTLVKEQTIIDIPIFLISADQKLHESLDKTSLDLFDGVISKNTIGNTGITFPEFIKMLSAYAEAYVLIQDQKSIIQLLKIEDIQLLDTRFVDEFEKTSPYPNHVIIRFISKEFIQKTTILVDEDTLASRLGIDMSSDDWGSFKDEFLKEFLYQGILSRYYERWWWPLIEDWWYNKITQDLTIRTLPAKERVEFLKSLKEGIRLKPASMSEKSKSDKFWTICKARKIPIDTVDGFLVAGQDNNFPWQEKEYVSNDEALRPKDIEAWKSVATVEKNRLQSMKDFYGKQEQRVRR